MGEDDRQADLQALAQRLDLLERENQRLRAKLEPLIGPENPCFDAQIFQRVLNRNIALMMIPVYALGLLFLVPKIAPSLGAWRIGPVQVFDLAGMYTRKHPGLGLGIVAVGGGAVGVVAVGGFAVGLIAFGGGAVGLIAIGGGSVGVIAIGGGACGYIAIAGGAYGHYAMGKQAHGRYALGLNRQDPEAIEFFVRFFPGLRAAVTNPMPVIMIEKDQPQMNADERGSTSS